MSTDIVKKRIERLTLERFRSLLPSFPNGEMTPCEGPDFTIKLDNGERLGIELTELHREVPSGKVQPQAQEALKHRAVKQAQRIYDSAGGPYLHVSVRFGNSQLASAKVPPLAKRIAETVRSIVPPLGEIRVAEPNYTSHDQFPKELHHLSAYNLPDATRSFFTAPGSTWVATLQDDDVKRVLASKEKKYERYRSQCYEVWLLISCNGVFMSTWFDGIEQFHGRSFDTQFDRIYLLSHFDNRLIEISRKNASGA